MKSRVILGRKSSLFGIAKCVAFVNQPVLTNDKRLGLCAQRAIIFVIIFLFILHLFLLARTF